MANILGLGETLLQQQSPTFMSRMGRPQTFVEALPPLRTAKNTEKRVPFLEGAGSIDALGTVVGPLLLLPFAVAFVGIVVAGAPALAADFPLILSQVILSQLLSTIVYVFFSQFRTCSNVDLLSAIGIAAMMSVVKDSLPADADLFVHMIVIQTLFTVLVAVGLALVAIADGMWYLRFLPYPVSSGFVMGIGFLILDGGFELGCGLGFKELVFGLGTLPVQTYQFAGLAIVGILFFYILSHVTHSGLRLPFGLVLMAVIVHGLCKGLGYTEQDLHDNGLMLEGLNGGSWEDGFKHIFSRFSTVHMGAILQTRVLSLMLSYSVLQVMCAVFYTASMQEIDKSTFGKKLHLKKEVGMVAASNGVTAVFGGIPMFYSMKVLVVMQESGASSRLWVILTTCTFAVFYFFADVRAYMGLIPKIAFAGLVGNLGVEFVTASYIEAKERIAPNEVGFALITGFVVWFDVLTGLAFGLFMVVIFFIVEYAGLTGINRRATLKTVRSNVERDAHDFKILEKYGDDAMVFWLTGYIFFGCAVSAVEDMEAVLDANDSLSIIILDFEHVPAVDASGIHHFTNFAGKCSKREPPVSVCFSGTVRRLKMALGNAAKSKGITVRLQNDYVEEALSWAEEELLMRFGDTPMTKASKRSLRLPVPNSEAEALLLLLQVLVKEGEVGILNTMAAKMAPSAKLLAFAEGSEIFKEGANATDLLFVLRGSVALTRELSADDGIKLPEHHLNKAKGDVFVFEERDSVRVQQVSEGSVLGATEYSFGKATAQWTTSGVAVEDSQILMLPFSKLSEALEENPKVGYAASKQFGRIVSMHLKRLMRRSEATAVQNL